MGKWEITKHITFRATEKTLEKIKETMKDKGLNKTQAILYLIERETTQPQLEQTETGDYFKLPPYLYCPEQRTWLLKDNLLDLHNEVGCLKAKCQKSCPAWRHKERF